MPNHRHLGFWEMLCEVTHTDYYSTGMVQLVAEITGPIEEGPLKKALLRIQERHPLLRAKIVDTQDRKTGFEVFETTTLTENALPLEMVQATHNTAWQDIYEARSKDHFETYLWKLIWITNSPEHHHFIVLQHHAISDAMSISSFVSELLSIYSDEPLKQPYDLLPSVEALLPTGSGGESSEFGPQKQAVKKWTYEANAPLENRQTKYIFTSLKPSELESFKIACRKHKVSLNSAINTALLRSMTKGQESVLFSSAIDLRRHCKPKVPKDAIGCYVMMVETIHAMDHNDDFWQAAQKIEYDLKSSILEVEKEGFLPKTYDRDLFQKSMQESLQESATKGEFPFGPGMSNVGNLTYPVKYGARRLKSMHFSTPQTSGEFMLLVYVLTFNKQINLVFAYTSPLISEKTATSLSEKYLEILRSASE